MTTATQQLSDPSAPPRDWAKLNLLMDKAKGRLFFNKKAGFLGSLLCNHKIIWDETQPTAWCNGTTLGFNPDFFLSLPVESRVTLIAHELWHTGFTHMIRRGNRDPLIWNYAADYVINNMLDHDGFTFENMGQPCLDHQYDRMTTEEIYDILIQDAQQLGSNPIPSMGGDLKEPEPGEATESKIRQKVVQARQAASMSKEAGSLPGEIEKLLNEFLYPALPWEQLLYRYFTEMSHDDFSWRRPSRRYEDEYLPSMLSDNGLEHLIYYLDVSGSISDAELNRFNSEVKYIHSVLQPKLLTVVTFDTKIQDAYDFTDDMTYDNIKVHGRGGTSFDPVYEHIIEHRPTAAVIFSDMYCQPMQQDPGVPVLWIVLDNPKTQTSFGKVIHIPKDKI